MANKSRNNDVLITALVLSLGFGDLFLHGKTCINEKESFFNLLGWILACAYQLSNVSLKKLKLAKKTQRTEPILSDSYIMGAEVGVRNTAPLILVRYWILSMYTKPCPTKL